MSKWILVALVFSTTVHADIIPVPNTVIPTRVEGAQPRNVVFILSDDHRFDAMSFLGHPFAKTPYMDAMAKEGAHLKNAFVTTSLCSPSRASILTGLYTFRHRVIDNQRPVPEGTLFFPQYLQRAGYKPVLDIRSRSSGCLGDLAAVRPGAGSPQLRRAAARTCVIQPVVAGPVISLQRPTLSRPRPGRGRKPASSRSQARASS